MIADCAHRFGARNQIDYVTMFSSLDSEVGVCLVNTLGIISNLGTATSDVAQLQLPALKALGIRGGCAATNVRHCLELVFFSPSHGPLYAAPRFLRLTTINFALCSGGVLHGDLHVCHPIFNRHGRSRPLRLPVRCLHVLPVCAGLGR